MDIKNSVLAASKQITEREKTLETTSIIEIEDIDFNHDNVFSSGDDEESVKELAQNIQENGLLHNIVVTRNGERYTLISGERRVKACKYLGKTSIRATIRPSKGWLEDFKCLCYANTETRKYTNESRDRIITSIREKVAENAPNEQGKLLVNVVASTFGVKTVQAYQYIKISEELIDALKELHYSDVITVENAALFSALPTEAQERIADIYGEEDEDVTSKALFYAKAIKSLIDKDAQKLLRLRWNKDYAERKLTAATEAKDSEKIVLYNDKLSAIELEKQKILEEEKETIKNFVIKLPSEQKKTPAEINHKVVNNIGKELDIYVKANGSNETIEKIRELLATLISD